VISPWFKAFSVGKPRRGICEPLSMEEILGFGDGSARVQSAITSGETPCA